MGLRRGRPSTHLPSPMIRMRLYFFRLSPVVNGAISHPSQTTSLRYNKKDKQILLYVSIQREVSHNAGPLHPAPHGPQSGRRRIT